MDILFENCFKPSKQYFEEMLRHSVYFSPRYLFSYALLLVIFLFALAMFLIYRAYTSVVLWLALVFPLVIFLRDFLRYKKNVRLSMAKMEELGGGQGKEAAVFVTETDVILGASEEKDAVVFPLSNFEKLKTTKNFIVLTTKSKNRVVLKKDGFVSGTADDFLVFMRRHIQ